MRDRLSELGLVSFCKSTGGKGLHVVTPLARPKKRIESELGRSEAIRPGRLQPNGRRESRPLSHQHEQGEADGQIFLDYLRNDQFSTAVAPLSPRARPNALVSMPVTWAQVKRGLDPAPYTIHTVPQLLKKSKAWADYCEGERSPLEAIERLGKPSLARKAA